MRHRVTKTPTRALRIKLPVSTYGRLRYMSELSGIDETDELVLRALTYLDRALCALSEGGTIVVRHRGGQVERLEP